VSFALPRDELRVRWGGGGDAVVVVLHDDLVTLLTTKPFAPGSRPEGTSATGAAIRVKTARCRRRREDEHQSVALQVPPDGAVYLLEGRLLDASRALRINLSDALASSRETPEKP
jgi:hypothetical protein